MGALLFFADFDPDACGDDQRRVIYSAQRLPLQLSIARAQDCEYLPAAVPDGPLLLRDQPAQCAILAERLEMAQVHKVAVVNQPLSGYAAPALPGDGMRILFRENVMNAMRIFSTAGVAALGLALAPAAQGQTVLTFEGVGDNVAVGNFYNGGAGGNLGIQFVNAFGLVDSDAGGGGNFANEPSPDTTIYFTSGTASTMNVAAGFTTGFSFFYSSSLAASVSVYSGLNATGTLLATLPLVAQYNVGCTGDPNGQFCNWTAVGVTFTGTAQSVNFGGTANQVGFDNITIGSATAGGAVPEPTTWAMLIAGFGVAGMAMRRRRYTARVTFA